MLVESDRRNMLIREDKILTYDGNLSHILGIEGIYMFPQTIETAYNVDVSPNSA